MANTQKSFNKNFILSAALSIVVSLYPYLMLKGLLEKDDGSPDFFGIDQFHEIALAYLMFGVIALIGAPIVGCYGIVMSYLVSKRLYTDKIKNIKIWLASAAVIGLISTVICFALNFFIKDEALFPHATILFLPCNIIGSLILYWLLYKRR